LIKAVVDPGVFIAALISPSGSPAGIIRAWQRGLFEIVVCPMLLEELTSTLLRRRFRKWIDANDAVAFVEILRLAAINQEDPLYIEPISRDPNDDYLIALARDAGAHAIVSGDADLGVIEGIEPPVVSPRWFLESLGQLEER
jgi:putative PIN family toxin of toxin-antitoxin system